jgi:hypothetical protein
MNLSEEAQRSLFIGLAEGTARELRKSAGTTTLTLWRTATVEAPWFGRGSYWTTSRAFADDFRHFIAEPRNQELLKGSNQPQRLGARSIYRAAIELPDREVCDVRPPGAILKFNDDIVYSEWQRLIGLGFSWVIFYETGSWRTRVIPSAIYLGDEPIRAMPA